MYVILQNSVAQFVKWLVGMLSTSNLEQLNAKARVWLFNSKMTTKPLNLHLWLNINTNNPYDSSGSNLKNANRNCEHSSVLHAVGE